MSKENTKRKLNKKNLEVGILGYGEVGMSIAKFYKDPKIKDLDRNDGLEGVEILNICIPWNEKFIDIVKKEIKRVQPNLTIIHSTVAPFTTQKIIQGLPKKLKMVVHSPVRGMHPDLYESIKIFIKYIGTDSEKAGQFAKEHLESLGIRTKVFQPSVTTEIGKLFSTSYYALCIAWHGEMKKICDRIGVDFEEAVTDFNRTYNKGYSKLGRKNVVRPVLYPPKGGIGGHCIIPNAKILKRFFNSKAIDLILKYKPKKNKKE